MNSRSIPCSRQIFKLRGRRTSPTPLGPLHLHARGGSAACAGLSLRCYQFLRRKRRVLPHPPLDFVRLVAIGSAVGLTIGDSSFDRAQLSRGRLIALAYAGLLLRARWRARLRVADVRPAAVIRTTAHLCMGRLSFGAPRPDWHSNPSRGMVRARLITVMRDTALIDPLIHLPQGSARQTEARTCKQEDLRSHCPSRSKSSLHQPTLSCGCEQCANVVVTRCAWHVLRRWQRTEVSPLWERCVADARVSPGWTTTVASISFYRERRKPRCRITGLGLEKADAPLRQERCFAERLGDQTRFVLMHFLLIESDRKKFSRSTG